MSKKESIMLLKIAVISSFVGASLEVITWSLGYSITEAALRLYFEIGRYI